MIGFYLLGSVSILFLEWRQLDDVFQLIIKEAFTPAAPMGAFAGALVKNAIRWGFARGIFSNESGLGTGAIAAAAALALIIVLRPDDKGPGWDIKGKGPELYATASGASIRKAMIITACCLFIAPTSYVVKSKTKCSHGQNTNYYRNE